MDNWINKIAGLIDEANEPPEKVSPMVQQGDQRHKYDPEPVDDTIGSLAAATAGQGPIDPAEVAKIKASDAQENARSKEAVYQEKRRRAIHAVNQAVKNMSYAYGFDALLNALREHNIPGFEVLTYFHSIDRIRNMVKEQKKENEKKGVTANLDELYLKKLYNNSTLRSYTASSAVRKATKLNHPFRIDYDKSFIDQETGTTYPNARKLAKGINDILPEYFRTQEKLKKAQQFYEFPKLASQTFPKLAHLSIEDVKKRMQQAVSTQTKNLAGLEEELRIPYLQYNELISKLLKSYDDRINKLKSDFTKFLPERINHVIGQVYPKDYQDWVRTPNRFSPAPDTEEEAEDRYTADYHVEYNDGTVKVVPYDIARADMEAGLAKGIYQSPDEEEENPSLEANPEKTEASIEFYTLIDHDDDNSGFLCKHCNVHHLEYSEYSGGDGWNEVLSNSGYDPSELVFFKYEIGGDTNAVLIRRHEIAERNLLNDEVLTYAAIYPASQTDEESKVYAVKKGTNKLISLSYAEYDNLFAIQMKAEKAIKRGKSLEDMRERERMAMSFALPTNEVGGKLSEVEISQGEYDPVDNNGDDFKEVRYTDLVGDESGYRDNDYRAANSMIKSLRNDVGDRSDVVVYDQVNGKIAKWFQYNVAKDTGQGKLPPGALFVKLPPTPQSYKDEFGKERRRLLEVVYNGAFAVVKQFPYAVKLDDKWDLRIAKNIPLDKAVAEARRMWRNQETNPLQTVRDDKSGKITLNGEPNPNGILMTMYNGNERELISILQNIGGRDRTTEIKSGYCTGVVTDRASGRKRTCGNSNASNTSMPREVALMTDEDGKSTWEMVSKFEAEARNEYVNIQKGRESIHSVDALKTLIDRSQGSAKTNEPIAGYGRLCSSCWLNEWSVVPKSVIKSMWDDMERTVKVGASLLSTAVGDEQLAIAKKEIMDLVDKWVANYLVDGSFWKVLEDYVKESNVERNVKKTIINQLNNFYRSLLTAVHKLYDPTLNIINQTMPDPETKKPWVLRYLEMIMVQVNNITMWADGYRMHRYEHKDALGSRMDPNAYIIPFSRIDRKDVRDRRALSAALRGEDKAMGAVRWTSSFGESFEPGLDRVIIDGFLNEEAYYNGLVGYIVERKDGMCTIKLDSNDKTQEKYIKVYNGELSVIWEAVKQHTAEDEYEEYITEARHNETLKNDIISAISDDVSESPYY